MKQSNSLQNFLIGASLVSSMAFASLAVAGNGYGNSNHYSKNHGGNHNSCTSYRLSAYGGEAGFRLMSNVSDFRRTNNGSVVGQICSGGRVTVELSKRHPNTHVSLEVDGREYVFGQGDRGDKVINSWFRRYVNVNLSDRSNYSNRGHNNNQNYSNNGSYDSHGYGNRRGDQNGYRNGNQRSHNNHYGEYNGYNERSWFPVRSKKHRRAHKRGISHSHNGGFFAYN